MNGGSNHSQDGRWIHAEYEQRNQEGSKRYEHGV